MEDKIAPLVARDVQKARNAVGRGLAGEITVRTRLAVTLRWLAGGHYVDLCFAWGVGKSTFFSERGVLSPTIEALDAVHKLGFPINDAFAIEESVLLLHTVHARKPLSNPYTLSHPLSLPLLQDCPRLQGPLWWYHGRLR
jgi:hypothetical protein